MPQPYLSIIATTRNDNHGGDLLKRTTCFVEGVYYQAKKFNVEIELIIVEWNPPQDKALLHEVLPKPTNDVPVQLRYIVVPKEIHEQYSMANRMPLFQMTAKNVGIRRAKGEYILCTNIDLLFSDELFQFLSNKNLNPHKFYRANRIDVSKDLMNENSFDKQIAFAKQHIINRIGKTKGHEYIIKMPLFLFGFKRTTQFINFIYKTLIHLFYSKVNIQLWLLDTGACGDFTLMHKDAWNNIEGYPELDLYSIHIDSMGIISALALGYEQEILPPEMCSYHIYHEDGWESFKNSPIDLIRFTEKRPGLDWVSVYDAGKWIIENKQTWKLNKEDWGFNKLDFTEYIY